MNEPKNPVWCAAFAGAVLALAAGCGQEPQPPKPAAAAPQTPTSPSTPAQKPADPPAQADPTKVPALPAPTAQPAGDSNGAAPPPRRGPTPFPTRPAATPVETISTVGVPPGYDGPNKSIPKDAKPFSRMSAPDGLVIEDYAVGKGAVCLPKSYITIKGVGKFAGTEKAFVNDYLGGKAVSGNVENLVPALHDGIVGMRVGGQRRIYAGWNQGLSLFWKSVPDDKARYGVSNRSDLVYDIELMDVKSKFVAPSETTGDAPGQADPAPPAAPTDPAPH